MKNIKEIYMYLLGLVVIIGFFIVLYVIFKKELPSSNKDLALILFGVLGSKFGDVIGYFFGSSKSSADKTELLNK